MNAVPTSRKNKLAPLILDAAPSQRKRRRTRPASIREILNPIEKNQTKLTISGTETSQGRILLALDRQSSDFHRRCGAFVRSAFIRMHGPSGISASRLRQTIKRQFGPRARSLTASLRGPVSTADAKHALRTNSQNFVYKDNLRLWS